MKSVESRPGRRSSDRASLPNGGKQFVVFLLNLLRSSNFSSLENARLSSPSEGRAPLIAIHAPPASEAILLTPLFIVWIPGVVCPGLRSIPGGGVFLGPACQDSFFFFFFYGATCGDSDSPFGRSIRSV